MRDGSFPLEMIAEEQGARSGEDVTSRQGEKEEDEHYDTAFR